MYLKVLVSKFLNETENLKVILSSWDPAGAKTW